MFKDKRVNYDVANTVIGSEVIIQGTTFNGSGTIRIDGKYYGDMNIDGQIVIGEKGFVKGNIKTKHMLVAGTIEGDIECSEEVHLASTAQLTGNIISSILVVDEGAIFNGQCAITRNSDPGRGKGSRDKDKPE